MQVLYPVVQVLSLLAATGISVLFVIMSARDVSILRVLGTPKRWVRTILSAQQIFTYLSGLIAGFILVVFYANIFHPELADSIASEAVHCAMLYLAAGIIGSTVSASFVTQKNPLELLQVKE